MFASQRTFQHRRPDGLGVGLLSALSLEAEQQTGEAGDDRGGEAGAGATRHPIARNGPKNVDTRGQDSIALVAPAPIAEVHRIAIFIHGAHGKH